MSSLTLTPDQHARVAAVIRDGAPIASLASPEELHCAAAAWNWDDGLAALHEIVTRPDCALATAQLVFWRSLPDEGIGFFATRDDAEDEDGTGDAFDLQLLICDRVADGAYATHDLGFDPADDDGTDWTDDYPDEPAHPLPPALVAAVPGRTRPRSLRF